MSKSATTVRHVTQWIVGNRDICCNICGEQMFPDEAIQWDHIHAEVFEGPHIWNNLRPVHTACHKKKSAQDVKDNAKVKRLANPKPSKRPMQKSNRKMPSRKFQKRVK